MWEDQPSGSSLLTMNLTVQNNRVILGSFAIQIGNRLMLKRSLIASMVLFSLIVAGMTSSWAAVLTFTDRSSWRAAAGGGVGDIAENFDTFVGTTVYGNTTGVNAGAFNFSIVAGSTSDTSWSIRDSSPLAGAQTVNGTP